MAPRLLKDTLSVTEFVNADAIASGLSAFNSESVAITAGRVMLRRLKELAHQRVSFAFETTLASRSFAPWLTALEREGYAVHLVFLWLPSAELAVKRVADRVAMGGHDVPREVVRRRYVSGLRNFHRIYRPIATTWRVFDAAPRQPRWIAERLATGDVKVYDTKVWETLLRSARQR